MRKTLSCSELSSVGSPGGRGVLDAVHLPRETALGALDASETTQTALFRRRIRAAMAVDAEEIAAVDAVVASRLARDRLEDLLLSIGGRVSVGVIAPPIGHFATGRVEVVHVAHLELLDAVQGLHVVEEWRVDALSLRVVAESWPVDRA